MLEHAQSRYGPRQQCLPVCQVEGDTAQRHRNQHLLIGSQLRRHGHGGGEEDGGHGVAAVVEELSQR